MKKQQAELDKAKKSLNAKQKALTNAEKAKEATKAAATPVTATVTAPPKVAKPSFTPKQQFDLAQIELEEAQEKVAKLTTERDNLPGEISRIEMDINTLKGEIDGAANPSDPDIVAKQTKLKSKEADLKAKQERLPLTKRELITAEGVIEEKQKAFKDQEKIVGNVGIKKTKEEAYEAAKTAFIDAQTSVLKAKEEKAKVEAESTKAPTDYGIKTKIVELTKGVSDAEVNQKTAAEDLLKVKKELDALGTPITSPSDEEVLAAATAATTVVSGPPKTTAIPGSASGTATTPGSAPGTTATTAATAAPGPSPGLDATVSTTAEEVRFTFLKQRFIVENKFDGDKLLPKQRAFMTAMNILPTMASIDEKDLVNVLENIVNNKNCRSDSWIGLSVKCGPIRTLLNTLADRLWKIINEKDPDILNRQARLATGAVGGPGSVPGSLSPLGPSGIPPGGHPFDPKNDTIITIKLPLRSLYESAFGPSLLTMFEESVAGKEIKTTRLRNIRSEASNATRNTRGDIQQANNQLIAKLYDIVDNQLALSSFSSSSSSSSLEQPVIDQMRLSIIEMLQELQNDEPQSIDELKDHYMATLNAVLESIQPTENVSEGLIQKITPIFTAIINFEPTDETVAVPEAILAGSSEDSFKQLFESRKGSSVPLESGLSERSSASSGLGERSSASSGLSERSSASSGLSERSSASSYSGESKESSSRSTGQAFSSDPINGLSKEMAESMDQIFYNVKQELGTIIEKESNQ